MQLSTNQVYIPQTPARDSHRRIIDFFDDRVFYSTGGDSTHNCLIKSFLRWVKSHKGEVVNETH